MSRPPTVAQLLVLADRAERGPLTAPEASRLRAGIDALAAEREAADDERQRYANRADAANGKRRRCARQLVAARALVASARQRGVRSVPVWILAAALETTPEVRQREAA